MAVLKSFLKASSKKRPPNSEPSSYPTSLSRLNHHSDLIHVFNKFDSNGDGKISSTELGRILSALGHAASPSELAAMVREADSDGDGFIDLREFIDLNTTDLHPDEALLNLREAFSVYDKDGNGSISAEELREVLRSLGDDCTLDDCRKMISAVDKDGDGCICFEEFKLMMTVGDGFGI